MGKRHLAAVGFLFAALGLGLHSTLVAPRSLHVRHKTIALPRLPRAFDGYQIAHLSDLHLGGLASGAEHALAAAALRPDLFAVTGDLLDGLSMVDPAVSLMGTLHASDGACYVLGNHEHYTFNRKPAALQAFTDRLGRSGVRTLVNEAASVERDGTRLWFVGVDDPFMNHDDVLGAFAKVPYDEPSILLAHSPDVFLHLPPGRTDLVLTGHCHGGQVRTPWGPIVTRTRAKLPDVIGLHWIHGTPVNMSAGLGSTIPIRFLCPPEVTVLHLRCGTS
ncbi:MAG: metallophosphoesterase [Chloroflexi bacterium]|nr:metallophosphoesterase [Chloroflexota bacterium]